MQTLAGLVDWCGAIYVSSFDFREYDIGEGSPFVGIGGQ